MMHEIDPILVTVIQRRLKAITEEMGLTMLRTARSPILSEARDFVTGLYNTEGELIEQTAYIPILAFAVPLSIKYMVEYFGDELYPGDVIIHNDPYTGGNQPTDVKIVRPIFFGDVLVGFPASTVIRPISAGPWLGAIIRVPPKYGKSVCASLLSSSMKKA